MSVPCQFHDSDLSRPPENLHGERESLSAAVAGMTVLAARRDLANAKESAQPNDRLSENPAKEARDERIH